MNQDGKNTIRDDMPPGHEGGPPRKLAYMVIGVGVAFVLAIAVVWASIGTFQRPGQDPSAQPTQSAAKQ